MKESVSERTPVAIYRVPLAAHAALSTPVQTACPREDGVLAWEDRQQQTVGKPGPEVVSANRTGRARRSNALKCDRGRLSCDTPSLSPVKWAVVNALHGDGEDEMKAGPWSPAWHLCALHEQPQHP